VAGSWRTLLRRSQVDLPARLSALDDALRLADGRLDPALVERARAVRQRAAERLATAPDWVVAALAGGTGSGKSSLFNALAGVPLATVGARRPVTSHAQAWVVSHPDDARPDAAGPAGGDPADGSEPEALLDWLGVDRWTRAEQADLAGLVLLDLPDHDSVAGEHRRLVDRFVERVDVLVWVVDPLKYAQRALHDDYLRRLTSHARVLVVVLNRADELEQPERERCLADLRRLLDGEGLGASGLFTTSARTGEGVAELRAWLAGEVRRRRAVVERVAADITSVAAELLEGCGPGDGSGQPGGDAAGAVVAGLARAVRVGDRAAAAGQAYRLAAVARSRSLPARRWRRSLGRGRAAVSRPARLAPAASAAAVTRAVLDGVSDAKGGLPHPWPTVLHGEGLRAGEQVRRSLERVVADVESASVRTRWWWGGLGALRTLLAAVATVGFAWLGVLFVALYLQLPLPPAPRVGPLALPTVLLFGGLLAGAVVGLVARGLASLGARRHARRVAAVLRRQVADVADRELLEPLRRERATHDRLAAALRRAHG
jgi:GTP-binding protein EngB required for normal cell division